MQVSENISTALQQLEAVKAAIDQSDDPKLQASTAEDLNMLLSLLESPILRSIATLQDSVSMLATQVSHHPSILPGDFDITPSGELALQSRMLYSGHDVEEEQRVPQISPPHSIEFISGGSRINGSPVVDNSLGHHQAMNILHQARGLVDMINRNEDAMSNVTSSEMPTGNNVIPGDWAQVEVINLVNDGTGLGFGIIGNKAGGVIVKTILAGGVADRDGRLRSGDHILQIGDEVLLGTASEQVAGVLRASGARVRLVVARPVDPATHIASPRAPLVPARLISEPEELDRYLIDAGFDQVYNTQPVNRISFDSTPRYSFDSPLDMDDDPDSPEVDRFTVQLKKDENGLGITIAGYVCEKEELSGIFVKSVSPGSAAAASARVRVNDRIVAVDGVSLAGKSNQRAVDALKASGNVVTLELERYLRGAKFEQLQQAIAAGETGITPPLQNIVSTHNPFLHLHRKDTISPADIPLTQLSSSHILESSSVDDDDMTHDMDSFTNPQSHIETTINVDKDEYLVPTTSMEEEVIKKKWQSILGPEMEIVVGVVERGGGGLGISLEGTVDVEGGREVRPHHYVRSVLPQGPVGKAGLHKPGDELLEVNGQRLLGLNHLEVVSILKELPRKVCMVCARPIITIQTTVTATLAPHSTLVKAKSDGSLAAPAGKNGEEQVIGSTLGAPGSKVKSRSLEPLTGLAMWSDEPQVIELIKGERGLGFSILDYQDPVRPSHTVIVIRSLVPGGVAQQDGRLIPGDRLLSVNDQDLENATLEQAVQALKGAPRGVVRIGVAKPLPLADSNPNTFSSLNSE